MNPASFILLAVFLVSVAACGDDGTSGFDAANQLGNDAGTLDASSNAEPTDAGSPTDSATDMGIDASTVDAAADASDMADMADMCQPGTACIPGQCGMVNDGCGGMLDCGEPRTTCLSDECGMVDDGCGGTLDCGEPRKMCMPDECGMVDDGCGGMLDCVTCNCVNGVAQVGSCGVCGLGHYECAAGETGFGTCVEPVIPGLDASSTAAECGAKIRYVDISATMSGDGTGPSQPYSSVFWATRDATVGTVLLFARSVDYFGPLRMKNGVHIIGGFEPGTWKFDPTQPTVVRDYSSGSDPAVGVEAENLTDPTTLAYFRVDPGPSNLGANNIGVRVIDSAAFTLRAVTIETRDGGQGGGGAGGGRGQDGRNGLGGSNSAVGGFPRVILACPAANGGASGTGALLPTYVSGLPAPGGDSALGAMGGSAGTDGTDSDKAGGNGAHGVDGLPGTSGANGVFGGSIVGNDWVAAGNGTDGTPGGDGQGGGGGGGSWHGPQYCTMSDGTPLFWSGSTGALGATGGCAGGAGRGGQAGGAAIGILTVRSQIEVIESEVRVGNGGAGRSGGIGGRGGVGGAGKSGLASGTANGNLCDPPDSTLINLTLPWKSGNSGDGGDGGRGGDGGGGTGGPVFGILCDGNSTPTVDTSTTFTLGSPGQGGTSPAGGKADDGILALRQNCP